MSRALSLTQRAVVAPCRAPRRGRREQSTRARVRAAAMHAAPATGATSLGALVVRAHEDDEPLPLFRLPRQEVDLKKTPKPTPSLGGKTIGDELAKIYEQHNKAETTAREQMEASLYSSNWAGDVYIGSNWNVLSILYLIFLLTPIIGLGIAYMTYGVYWGLMPGM